MCGIAAYIGHRKNAPEIVIEGLKRLEYRGYDSWGVAYQCADQIFITKKVGKIGEFKVKDLEKIHQKLTAASAEKAATKTATKIPFKSSLAIGHTRWATHGGVTTPNAHPHTTEDQEITIVHNGIIENYQELKTKLKKKGHTFRSQTDTEVIAHLIEDHYKKGDLEAAVKKTIQKLEGRYAILVISKDQKKLIAARRGSPLIIGVGTKEYFIASDIPAFLPYTRRVMYLDDNQMVVLNDKLKFIDLKTNRSIQKRIVKIDWDIESAEKGDYPHFMLKEIMEQKDTLERAANQDERQIKKVATAIKNAYGTFFVGCGTAGKVCLCGQYLFSEIAQKHVNATFGSEFPSFEPFLKPKSLLLTVSQSGETADTLEAMEVATKKGATIVSVVNVESSTMARHSNIVLPIKVGPEKAVASTKATTAQMAILTLLAYALADRLHDGKRLLINTASQINDMLNPRYEKHIEKLAHKIKNFESMYVIGKSLNYPMALEAAIKLQEVSYIHAEGFAGGELKHGPIALISKGTPCIAIVANDKTKNDTLSNAIEIKARGGYIIGVAPENNPVFDYWIRVPDAGNASPIVNIIPIQILAYQLAVLRQNNPDMPRNLAKSVTVK